MLGTVTVMAEILAIGTIQPGMLVRESLDEEHVTRLMEAFDDLPPILVDRRSRRVVDGDHRLEAHRRSGRLTIAVEWLDGDDGDHLVASLAANVRHGLPLTRSERRRGAERLVAQRPGWSNRRIAECAVVSEGTIRNIRAAAVAQQPAGAQPTHPERVVGRDGKSYPARPTGGGGAGPSVVTPRKCWLRRMIARLRDLVQRLLGRVWTGGETRAS